MPQSTRHKFRIIEAEAFIKAGFKERIIIVKRPGSWQLHLVTEDGTLNSFASFHDQDFFVPLVADTALRARMMRGVKVAGIMLDMTEEDRARLLDSVNSVTLNNAPLHWDVDNIDELKQEVV